MKEEKKIYLNIDHESFYKIFSGELKEFYKNKSEFWTKVFHNAKANNINKITFSNGTRLDRAMFVIELTHFSIQDKGFYFEFGKIISSDIEKVTKTKTKKQPNQEPTSKEQTFDNPSRSKKGHTKAVLECIQAISKELKATDFKSLERLDAEELKNNIIKQHSDNYKLKYLNIKKIYHGSSAK